eukprot:scaffold4703_cov108-Cylindrotheca_fusiformis.AAC.5
MGCFGRNQGDESDDDSVQDRSASKLSHVGKAAYEVLRTKHSKYHKELWNVTAGRMEGNVQVTPKDAFTRADTDPPPSGHDQWFPDKVAEVISTTEQWCDIMTLNPPDGLFMESIKKALADLCKQEVVINRIIVRMIFGNIIGMPCNCNRLLAEFTKDLPPDAHKKLRLWVGSWRKGASWNHAKIIAVDGKFLWTGGHNWWDYHYLRNDPVVDASIQLSGPCAVDAHYYANKQWSYIQRYQSTCRGQFIDRCISDAIDLPLQSRVSVTEYPSDSSEFPPVYKFRKAQKVKLMRLSTASKGTENYVPVITIGRQGTLFQKHRPSDDAFAAMIESTQRIVRLSLQDLGPIKVPGTSNCLPGLSWPKPYIQALAKIIWEKDADVEIVLSNPNSIPGGLSMLDAQYGFGWSCVDVASEIIKRIRKMFPDGTDADLRRKVQENLRVCFIRSPRGGTKYKDTGTPVGLHTKHFIVDDTCAYIGSQNLYMSDLAEWGVVIDHPATVQKIKMDFWDPMWHCSYRAEDCNVDEVMDGMKIDRGPAKKTKLTKEQLEACGKLVKANNQAGISKDSPYHTENEAEVKRFNAMPQTGLPRPTHYIRERLQSGSSKELKPNGNKDDEEKVSGDQKNSNS